MADTSRPKEALNRLEEIYHQALQKPEQERPAFLDQACAGDDALRREVEELLSLDKKAGSFMESPAIDMAAQALARKAESAKRIDFVGQTILHYKVLEKIGEGGMGVVYRALDTHLQRPVAIKVLPPEIVADRERRLRFVQEARAASALNHPNIITIHDIDQVDGTDFIAMEYVTGKTLAELIPRKGMKLNDALKYSIQIADALAAAHAAGIVHRDLKPANVMITQTGLVKVLDFGLAKLTERAEPDASATTETLEPRTEEGTILGTVAYMSPEQAAGRKVDARSDIFSFGSVLYEMVTGRRAFEADSKFSTLAAVIESDPASLAGEVPYDLEKIVIRCLRKDPERRFQHMHDLKVLLQEFKEDSDSGRLQPAPVASKQARPLRLVIGAVAAVVLIVLSVAVWYGLTRQRSVEPGAPLTVVPLTSYPGYEHSPSFSPDGRQVAFQWCTDGPLENCDIYIKQIGVEPPQRLTTDPARDFSPVWSPDGQSIAFLRERSPNLTALILIPQRGGQELVLGESNVTKGDPTPQLWLDWTPDSKWLVLPWSGQGQGANGLSLLNVETRETQPLTTGFDYGPAFSPDGRSLLFVRDPLGLFLLRVRQDYQPQEEPQQIVAFQEYVEAAWTSDGKEIVFSSSTLGRGLWRMNPFSSTPPWKLPVGEEDILVPAVSRHGNRLAYDVAREDYNIWRVDLEGPGRNPGTPTQFIASTRQDSDPAYSPDGKRIAFTSDRSGSQELWVCNADGSNAVRLTSLKGAFIIQPRWSPDGHSIAMWKIPDYEIYTVSADGGIPRLLTKGRFPSWSWDGQWLYFSMDKGLWKIPPMGGKAVHIQDITNVDIPQESPDGKSIYYSKGWAPNCSVWKIPTAGGEEVKVLDSTYGFWTMGSQGIYYFSPADGKGRRELRVFNLATGESKRILSVERRGWFPTASPDGKTILYLQQDQAGSDLMLVENFR